MSQLRSFNPYRQAAHDLAGIERTARGVNIRWNGNKCCWRCQKDKNSVGGTLRAIGGAGGLMCFICADCLVERAAKKAAQES